MAGLCYLASSTVDKTVGSSHYHSAFWLHDIGLSWYHHSKEIAITRENENSDLVSRKLPITPKEEQKLTRTLHILVSVPPHPSPLPSPSPKL